jgi:hypothetical protein
MKSQEFSLMLLLLFCSLSAYAKAFKCTDSAGKVIYTSSPCSENQTEKQMKEQHSSYHVRSSEEETRAKRQSDEAAIVAKRRDEGEVALLERQYRDALERRDMQTANSLKSLITTKIKTLKGVPDSYNDIISDQAAKLQGQISAQRAQTNMQIQAQKMLLESQMHRMEMQQNLRNQGILK